MCAVHAVMSLSLIRKNANADVKEATTPKLTNQKAMKNRKNNNPIFFLLMLNAKGMLTMVKVSMHMMGCRYDGQCESKNMVKSNRSKRDSFRVYCYSGGLCNQQVYRAPKCEASTVEAKNP